jgi:hypothetical protein
MTCGAAHRTPAVRKNQSQNKRLTATAYPSSPNLATFPAFHMPHFLARAGNNVWLRTSRKKENATQ